ncbi:MAG: glycosyltransferase family 9 protein [Chthoniobacteraceae bacterium]
MPFPNPKTFRKKTYWLIALGTEATAPLLRAYARTKTGPPSDPRQWRKALIIGDNHIGDLLYRSASLGQLKAGLPDCELHYLAAPASAQILEGNPALASILPWARSSSPLDLDPAHFAALREMRFDAALCTNCIKYWPELLLALRLGIPNRAAYTYKGFSAWATRPIPIRYPQPFAVYFRDYVAALTGAKPCWPARPIICTNERDEAEAEAIWAKLRLGDYRHVTACFVTSRQPTGVWPVSRFGETLRALRRKRDTHIVLCGAAPDETLLAGVNKDFGLEADIVAGALGLRALCCFLRRCSAVLTADSGPRHIANAAGAPVAFVRNVWFDAVEAGAYVDTEIDLCGLPPGGGHGDGAALLGAIDPERAGEVVAGLGRFP